MTASLARRTLTVFFLSLSVLLLGASCAGEQAANSGGKEGTNGGGDGQEAEAAGVFDDFDANNNNEIYQQEFDDVVADAGLLFDGLDADNNNAINEKEFREGIKNPKTRYGRYGDG